MKSVWKANGQCSRGVSCSFSHGNNRGQQTQSSSLAPQTQTQIDGRRPSKGTGPKEKVLLEGKAKKRAKVTSKEIARIRRVIIGILPYVEITNLNRDANRARNVDSDMLRLTGKKSKKSGAKGQLPH